MKKYFTQKLLSLIKFSATVRPLLNFKYMKVTLMMTTTLDGRIAKHADHMADWSEKADKALFRKKTQEAGVLVMGSKTFDTIGKPLPNRKNIVMTQKTDRISRDSNLIFTNDSPKKILADLESEGFEEVIVAGGTLINSLFAKENLLDELLITISPVIFGSGISLFNEKIEMNLELKSVEKLGENSMVALYKVPR